MFKEMHHMDRKWREMDLAEKMAERRRQSLAASRKARMLFALGGYPIRPRDRRERRHRWATEYKS